MTPAKVASYITKRVLRNDQDSIHSDSDRIEAPAISLFLLPGELVRIRRKIRTNRGRYRSRIC
jgi:hypothetical protein